ncbi:inorganic phosphate transporter : Probable low-affinity inorganic phosphate permease OS=Sorangium cellulosum (strain So ce56) GN=pit1 PE=4 SV=1: PHO4 [Gemmata massiliana]|uniref:Phosphate transporter n=1 Tax=Gemmata massiliana TaxID=1210884 RepID=A0A6P2CXZ1_9BACT|nr:inorganic phosphate transporter [Gemmata massiliana]VTR93763.1 inorganic phosphate transporter : Probable low-affinity inorganic phosphate permease OS=Sorangium cellulosum (strain So ce56) GN=pit1 PE=4 SV=1: PHO4 [Gemmata massiliana]
MASAFIILVLVVVLALVFDYINGFHDTANAVATVVSTNVLPGRTAVLLAAVCNFVGAFIGVGVAKTIGGDIADPKSITQLVVAAALLGAIVWNLLTWYYGIPSSSSHALIGGLVGAVWCYRVLHDEAPLDALWGLLTSKGVLLTLKALVISPLCGLLGGFLLMVLLLWVVRRARPATVSRNFRVLQLVSAGFMAFAHGSNDAQKSMGIITLALVAYAASLGQTADLVVPGWVIVSCATAMALGTASGGWRIMKTMGHRIIKLRPINGFAAETAASLVILGATWLKAPVSTTHVISSSIMGVGASKRVSAVRWGVAQNMLIAWVLTIPISAAVSALTYLVLHWLLG